jgi:hypothetical protein
VLAPVHVELDDRQPRPLERAVERLAQRGRDLADAAEARRVEAAAVTEQLADLVVLPRGHVLEHLELRRDEREALVGATQQAQRRGELVRGHPVGRLGDLGDGELQPQLGRLVDGLEQELVAMRPLVGTLLEREQLVGAQVPLVVARSRAREDGSQLLRHRGI